MTALKGIRFYLLPCCMTLLFQPLHRAAQQNSGASSASQQAQRDGQRDFDFEIGTWKTHLKLGSRLGHPFTGPNT